jgi:hypothetical protein
VGLGARLGADAWLLARLVILFFHLPSNVFSTTLCTRLGLSHPLILRVSHCICNQPLDPMVIHLFHYAHGERRWLRMMLCKIYFTTIAKNVQFHVL